MIRFDQRPAIVAIFAAVMSGPASASTATDLTQLQHDWAHIKYELPGDQRKAAFGELAQRAHVLTAQTGSAPMMVWEAIILASLAGEKGAFGGALDLVKDAKALLDKVMKTDPGTLDGSAYTTLGSLYYQVPGWPIGFGDDDKARTLLTKAVQINPDGMDANYFYGDFLLDQGDYPDAIKAFEKAVSAPPRPDRPVADAGRRHEAEEKLAEARSKQKQSW